MYTNIQKWGNSQGIRIPKTLLDIAGLEENEEVELVAFNEQIIVKKVIKKRFKTLEERFKDYDGDYDPTSFKWDDAMGKEIL